MDTEGSESLAKAFSVPVVLDSELRDGSLREAASNLGIFCSGLWKWRRPEDLMNLMQKWAFVGTGALWSPWK